MKVKSIVWCVGILIFVMGPGGGSFMIGQYMRIKAQKWPYIQLENACDLGIALFHFKEKEGYYPEELEDLVHQDFLTAYELQNLQFRKRSGADSQDWVYRRPSDLDDVAIISPEAVFVMGQDSGVTIIARPNGGGEIFSESKKHHYLSNLKAEDNDAEEIK